MTYRFPIKEIARQAGLSTATVDRVLNRRLHVSPQSVARVNAAILELESQEQQLTARGRRLFIDVLVEAPQRFSRQVRAACESVLQDIDGAVFRPRFRFQEVMQDQEMVDVLSRILKRGSHGVILKARDSKEVAHLVDLLHAAEIPVVTLVIDIPDSKRAAYVGMDNKQAGATAAYILANMLNNSCGRILISQSQREFIGETERKIGFKQQFLAACPNFEIIEVCGGAGLASGTRKSLSNELDSISHIHGVYSVGGGNDTILATLADQNTSHDHFIAHDLDIDNRRLLEAGKINFVLHHDLRADMKQAFRKLSVCHGLAASTSADAYNQIQIITPLNIPV